MAETYSRNRIMYDGLYTFVMRLANVACAAGLGIMTARLLGPAGKGLYALPSVEAGLLVSAFTGLSSATSYYLIHRNASRRVVPAMLTTAAAFVAVAALLLVPIAWVSHHLWSLLPAVLSLPASAAINLACGYTIGIKRVRYATTINVAVTVVTLIAMASGLLLVARAPGIAIAAWIAASTVVAIVALGAVIVHSRRLPEGDQVSIPECLRFSAKVGAGSLVSLLNYRADLYIVALLTSAAALGMYTVAVSAAESLLVPTQVAALVTSPHIGSLDAAQAANLTARCVRNNLLIAVLLCGVLFVFAGPLIALLYGGAFLPMVAAFRILLVGVVAISLSSPMAAYFTLKRGQPEVALVLAGISAAICISLSFLLVPSIGINGAAIASTAAYAVGQTAATYYFCRVTGMSGAALLLPRHADFATYADFARRTVADGRELLRTAVGGAR